MTTAEAGQVAVLGTGAIGTTVARTLLAAGRSVLVWNRTPSRAASAVAAGARQVATAGEAVDASDVTLACLVDHEAAVAVLESLRPIEVSRRRTVVVLTTGTPEETAARDRLLAERGLDHLDAGVQAGAQDVGTPAARFYLAGDRTVFDRHRTVLELLGDVRWVGQDPTAAAVWDLALFGLWYDAQVGLLRALELAAAAGVDPEVFAESAAGQLGHVVSGAGATAREVAAADHPPGPASVSEHLRLVRQLVEQRRAARTGDGGLPTVERLLDGLVASGKGGLGLSAMVSDR